MEKSGNFYVVPSPDYVKRVKSKKGREAFRKAEENARQAVQELKNERAITREMLQIPITI
jgi:hypothetical protein